MSATPIAFKKFADSASLNAQVVALLREALGAAGEGPRAVMLSGGSTPRAAYAALAADPCPCPESCWITYTDERHVPVDHPDSNHGQTRPLLDALGIPAGRVLRPDTALDLAAAAAQWDADFRVFLDAGGRIPLALLGLGADGHTCSIFSDADVDQCGEAFAAPILRPEPPHRITVGPALLRRADRIVFLVAGRDKDDVVAQLRSDPAWLPAGRAVAGCARLELWNA
jgi:6-phosphogluconolactonase